MSFVRPALRYAVALVEIRAVRPHEYEEAGRVTADAYREFVRPEDRGWEEYLHRLADVAGRAHSTLVLGAFQEGRILGTATLELEGRVPGGHDAERGPLRPGEAHVRMVGVDPDARGRGIGRKLMEACIEEARKAGKTILTLNTTERMRVAQEMYESMGFHRAADQVFSDGFRLLTYELPL